MIGRNDPLVRLAKGRPIHAEKCKGRAEPVKKLPRTAQHEIDTCVDRCPWPDTPRMCEVCKGRPHQVQGYRRPTKTVRAHQRQALILWLEWRARQPDNPDPERTREILKGVRNGAYS